MPARRRYVLALLLLLAFAAGRELAAGPPVEKLQAPRDVSSRDEFLPEGAIRRFGSVQYRHPGGISGSALSEDGKWLATAARRSITEREAATKALTTLGPIAGPALKETLAKNLSPETKERVQKLVAILAGDLPPEALRQVRAVQALELAGTDPAKSLLKEWAAGAPGAVLTEDAKAALDRLKLK